MNQRCPICGAAAETLYSRAHCDKTGVCDACDDVRIDLLEAIQKSWAKALERQDEAENQRYERLSRDFFSGEG